MSARGALGPNNQLFQAFCNGGPTRTLTVGATWTEFVPGNGAADLFKFYVPSGTLRVCSTSSRDIPDLEDGAPLLPAHRPFMLPVPPGWDIEAFDRDDRDGVGSRFFYICDPDDETPDLAPSADVIFRQSA